MCCSSIWAKAAATAGCTALSRYRCRSGLTSVPTGSALVLVFWSRQYPFVQAWLTAKVLALVVYIVLGTVALKRGKTRGVRAFALLAALATFAYIVAVALTRDAGVVLRLAALTR